MLKKTLLLAFWGFEAVLAGVLVPIPPPNSDALSKREQQARLDLQNSEVFFWGDQENGGTLARFNVEHPGDEENILSMERFNGMVTAIECSNTSLSMTFKDNGTFQYAQQVWDWVNGADNHTFTMITGPGDCGPNTDRTPYTVSTLQFDDDARRAVLTAQRSSWVTIAHTYQFWLGRNVRDTSSTNTSLIQRDPTVSKMIDFKHKLNKDFQINAGKLQATLSCADCSSSGAFDLDFSVVKTLKVVTSGQLTVSPRAVSATAKVKLEGSGTLTEDFNKPFDLLSIPIDAIDIGGVLSFGPFLTFSIGAVIHPMTLSTSVTTGATVKLDDKAQFTIDLLHREKNSFSGWEPQVDVLDTVVEGTISGGVGAYLQAALQFKAELLGYGWDLGFNFKLPNVNAKLEAVSSSKEACANTNKPLGVKVNVDIGAQLDVSVTEKKASHPLFQKILATTSKPIAEKCIAVGKENSPSSTPASSTSQKTSKSPTTSATAGVSAAVTTKSGPAAGKPSGKYNPLQNINRPFSKANGTASPTHQSVSASMPTAVNSSVAPWKSSTHLSTPVSVYASSGFAANATTPKTTAAPSASHGYGGRSVRKNKMGHARFHARHAAAKQDV